MDFSANLTCTNTFRTHLMDLVSGGIFQSLNSFWKYAICSLWCTRIEVQSARKKYDLL